MGDERAIRRIIEDYPRAFELGDTALWKSLFWLDDPDFIVIENDKKRRTMHTHFSVPPD